MITAFGSNGERIERGGSIFRVTVRGPGKVDPIVTDRGNGTYSVMLTYPMSGKYEVRSPSTQFHMLPSALPSLSEQWSRSELLQVRIKLGMAPIRGSPFTVTVRKARRQASECAVATQALEGVVCPLLRALKG